MVNIFSQPYFRISQASSLELAISQDWDTQLYSVVNY